MRAAVLFGGEESDGHGAVSHFEFVIQVLEMVLDRILGNAGARGNLHIRPSVGEHREQFSFARGEFRQRRLVDLGDVDIRNADPAMCHGDHRIENDAGVVELVAESLGRRGARTA